ncbi:MAG: PAS domain S-box protein, partial [Cyclobacteriaceae bacterium]
EKKSNDLYLNNLKTAFEQTSSSVVITDKEGTIQYVNKKFSEITGYSLSEVVGKNPRILKTGNTSKQQYQMLWDIILSGKTWRGQFLNRKKSGEKYWEKAVIAPVFDANGDIINFVAVKEDITQYKAIEKDRERIEKALKTNEEKFRSLFNLATDPIFISDFEGNLMQANDLACKLFNLDCNAINGLKLQYYFDASRVSNFLHKIGQNDQSKYLQEFSLAGENKEIILEFNSSIMNVGTGSFILTIARDITQRKNAEKAIVQSETRFRLLVENIRAIFWMLDLETLNPLYISPNFIEIFGYTVDELLQGDIKNYLSIVHPEDINYVKQLLNKSLKNDINQSEFRVMNKNGDICWMQFKSYVITTPESKRVQVGLCEDVTERMHISKQLQEQNKELNKINKELDQFVYRVSHNLRAPLTSILGIVNLLKAIKTETEKSHYIKLIETSILKLDETIHEIIDYSKNSRIEVQSELLDLEVLVRETLDSLRFMNEKNTIVVKLHNQVNRWIYSDSNRLKVIFNNLISNAFKYLDDSKEQSFIEIKLLLIEDQLNIKVKDNGIGIRKDDWEKIFSMFYRGTDKSFGAGLGLAIVKEVVEKMNGTVQLDSQVYEFTEFNITLPIRLN